MKKANLFSVLLLLTIFTTCAQAYISDDAIKRTAPNGLDSLEHNHFYIWQIAHLPALAAGEHITEAGLLFKGINNWKEPDNDMLYIHLLSNSQIGDAVGALGMQPAFNPTPSGNSKVYTGNDKYPKVTILLGGETISVLIVIPAARAGGTIRRKIFTLILPETP